MAWFFFWFCFLLLLSETDPIYQSSRGAHFGVVDSIMVLGVAICARWWRTEMLLLWSACSPGPGWIRIENHRPDLIPITELTPRLGAE